MGLLLWIARAILILLILRIVLRLLFAPRGGRPAAPPPGARPAERAGGELVRDPQCGTYVPKARAITVHRGSETLYFCSTTCRDQFAGRG